MGALFAMLGVATWVHWRNTVQVDETSDEVAHTREVMGTVEHVLRLNVDMETGLRGYVISGDEALLEPLKKGNAALPGTLARLAAITQDNPVQRERVAVLEKLASAHADYRLHVADLVRSIGWDAARAQLTRGEGKRLLDDIRTATRELMAAEEVLLRERISASDAATRRSEITLAVLALLAAGTLVGSYVGLRRSLAARVAAEEALRRNVSEERHAAEAIKELNATLDERVRQRTTELRASEARLRTTLDNLLEGVQIIGFDWRYHYINAAAATQGRSTIDALLGRTMMEAYPGIENTPLFATLTRCMETRSSVQIENDFVYPDGSAGTFHLLVQPVPEGIFILSMDISARKQAERLREVAQEELERRVVERTEALRFATEELEARNLQLEQASRHKSEFLANMSHELRTPLNAIIGFSEILHSGLAGELTPRQREFTGDIHSSGTHLLALISDILDLAKIEAGSMTLDHENVGVAPLVESCLAVVREKATGRNLDLRREIDPGLGAVVGDTRKLKQIVVNLLSNAVKFTDPGGRVVLTVRRIDRARIDAAAVGRGRVLLAPSVSERAFIEIVVQDSGIGIAEADLARLFQPFVQVDASTKRRHDGTGLGLALVRRLVDLHGGGLAVDSAPGRGSRFTVWLPYHPAPRAETEEDVVQRQGS